MTAKPNFLITIDTEGDNLWSRPQKAETKNSAFLPRFQQLCERYGFKPTWLTNYEMAECPVYRGFARDVLDRGTAEIGMHLHAWNSPPVKPLVDQGRDRGAYLVEYPDEVMREKIAFMTEHLLKVFGVRPLSHRAGRWAMDERYARMLIEQGYLVDCSVTPRVSWENSPGATVAGGTDYRGFPEKPYFMDPEDISRPGDSPLLQLPMTIAAPPLWNQALSRWARRRRYFSGIRRRLHYYQRWLRPNGRNLGPMLGLLKRALRRGDDYVMFMLHSSEFMPGGSPTFKTGADVEKLYADMESLFETAARDFRGSTLAEYRRDFDGAA
jgi:hypothetical protein